MQEQFFAPQRPNPTQFGSSDGQQARDAWKAQLDQWLHEYRDRYVLRQPHEKHAP
ncbi:MAG TPA: hypothetical protein VGE92_12830 [Steroidobacteraceae bacterium]